MPNRIVYKSAGLNDEYLIKMRISDTKTNMKRKVINKRYAKFRTNKAFVLSIVDKMTGEEKNTVSSAYDNNFKYTKNKWIHSEDYDESIDQVCTTGIHFFLDKERAFLYGMKTPSVNSLITKILRPPYLVNNKYTIWDDDGAKSDEIPYKNNKIDGIVKDYYDNENLRSETTYVNDKKHGPSKEYNDDKELFIECNYFDDELHGMCKRYYGNKEEIPYHHGKIHGIMRIWSWNKDKILIEETEYKYGNKDGRQIYRFDNGDIKSIQYFKNDEKHGSFEEWWGKDRRKTCAYYLNDKLSGPYKSWHDNGRKSIEAMYDNGELEGPYNSWHEKGIPHIEAVYENGQIKKYFKSFNVDGEPIPNY